MKILAIAKVGLKECLGFKVVYLVFIMSVLFILLGKSCSPGKITGNDVFFDAQARQSLAMKVAFNGIVLWSMMFCGLVAANIVSRELEDGSAIITLSRPLSRLSFMLGKVLSVLVISVVNLFLLGGIFFVLFYIEVGHINFNIFLSFFFVILNLIMYTLLIVLLTLFMPRFITPLIGLFIYLTSCWAALPFYYTKLNLLWIPSDTVINLHRYLPRFGDLQFICAGFIDSLACFNELAVPLFSILFYCVVLWFLIMVVFKRRQI